MPPTQAFSSIKPDILVLACLRGDEQARTYILPVSAILANLSAQERELAREPLWTTGVDLSFKVRYAYSCPLPFPSLPP